MRSDLWKIENVSGWLDENHTLAGRTPNLEILDQSPDHGSWIRSSQDVSRMMDSSSLWALSIPAIQGYTAKKKNLSYQPECTVVTLVAVLQGSGQGLFSEPRRPLFEY